MRVKDREKLQQLAPVMRDPCAMAYEHARELLSKRPELSGYSVHVWETWRTHEKQWAKWAKGREQRDGKWVVTNHKRVITWSRPEESAHCVVGPNGEPAALAFDLVLASRVRWLPDGHPAWGIIPTAAFLAGNDFFECGAMFKSIPGGDWPHCQRRNWREVGLGDTVQR